MAEAKSWFRDYIKRFFLLTGHTDDVFCLPGLEQLSLPEALHRHLRQQGYKRVVFYSGRQKLFCYDSVSYELLRYPDQAATQLAASEQEQAARRQSAAASRLAGGPLGAAAVPKGASYAFGRAVRDDHSPVAAFVRPAHAGRGPERRRLCRPV